MRNWGVLDTAFYAIVVFFVLNPVAWMLAEMEDLTELSEWSLERFSFSVYSDYLWWALLLWAGVLVAGQALLLFVTVDTSFRRIQERRHIGIAVATVALLVGLLSSMAIWSGIVAARGDDILPANEDTWAYVFWALVAFFWLVWGTLFYFYKAGSSYRLDWVISWLIKGSILELLIAVPSHVIVRHRGDCSAPIITGYGIATGIAVMLMAFGPSVLFLYQKRIAEYKTLPKSTDS
jgi:hypothetical protein